MLRVSHEVEVSLQLTLLMILKRARLLLIILRSSRLILVEKDYRLRWILISVRLLMAGQVEIWSKIKIENNKMF